VAWDGGDHAFLLDTKVAGEHQRQGIATALVGLAARHAQAAGCEWLHVDFAERLLGLPGRRPLIRPGLIAGQRTSQAGRERPKVWGTQRPQSI
jgi:GNAT superfamily N-acetyltransferase